MFTGKNEQCIEYLKQQKEGLHKITKIYKKRTNKQNSYYWAEIIPRLAEYTGYTNDEMHDSLKAMFLTDYSLDIPKVRGSKELGTKEFMQYQEQCIRLCAEQGVYIAPPYYTNE